MKSPSQLTEAFRRQGRKVTPQRQCIFRILHRSGEHLTAESVFAQASTEMPTISLRTVYQTLNDLTAMGEIVQHDLGTGAAWFDPNLGQHHHLVCDRCGGVADLHTEFPEVKVPARAAGGFQVHTTEIVFRGRCSACSDPASSVSTDPSPQTPTKEAHQRHG